MSKIVLAFDMDDTLTKTNAYINKHIKIYFQQNNMMKEYDFIINNEATLSTMMYPDWIKVHVDREIIGPGLYMLNSEPTQLGLRNCWRELQDFKNEYPSEISYVICSHRGFHVFGDLYTRTWLETMMLSHLIDDIYMLDGKDNPNKVEYLKSIYPDSEIILVDDNPCHDFTKDHPEMEELVIYDKVNKYEGYSNQKTFESVSQLVGMMKQKLVALGVY